MDQPSASVATVRSFKESARNSTVIFPALQFSCSGIVTHVNMSFVNRTELCSMMRGSFSGATTFHIQLSVWETIGQDYRSLGEHRVGVAVEEVIRQCDLQQQSASVTVQFTLDSQLLVQPGYTIGFHYPFVYSFSTVEARIDQVFGGVTPKSLSIEFVEATSAVAILTKRSEITLNTIVTVEQSQFNIAPKVGFSIDGQCGTPSPCYWHAIAYRSLNLKTCYSSDIHSLYPFFVVCSLLCGSFRVHHLSLNAARPRRHPLCHTAGWLLHGHQRCSSVHCFDLCVKETAKQSKEWWIS